MSWSVGLEALKERLGEARVSSEPSLLERLNRSTQLGSGRLIGWVKPASVEQLQELMKIATQNHLPLYPISGGKSWGLGCRVPPKPAALLDLSDLKRISEYDERLACVSVEPGVSFAQVYQFLKAQRSRLFLNVTGSSPHASVLANALERGDGAGPYGERFAHIAGLSVVLATGELVHTGFSGFSGVSQSRLHQVHPYGVGPALSGLFSQSNLGVVVRATIWLRPLPRSLQVLRFGLAKPAGLGRVVNALAALRLEGTLNSGVGLWNDYRVVSAQRSFPFELASGAEALPRAVLEALPEHPGERYSFTTALYGASEAEGRARYARVEQVLRPLVQRFELRQAAGEAQAGRELFAPDEPSLKFLQGIPHEHSLRSMYWRKRGPIAQPDEGGVDPERDGCGVLWVCVALPLLGEALVNALKIVERLMPEHGFEPLIAATVPTERCLYLVPMLVYDQDEPGQGERALLCHDALYSELAAQGYLPYRLGSQSMAQLPKPQDARAAVLSRIKQALDPAQILAPGRYEWPE